jgi:hypothetical protein
MKRSTLHVSSQRRAPQIRMSTLYAQFASLCGLGCAVLHKQAKHKRFSAAHADPSNASLAEPCPETEKRSPGSSDPGRPPSERPGALSPFIKNRALTSHTLPTMLDKGESEPQPIPSTDGTKHNHGHGQAHVEECVKPLGFVMHPATVGAPNAVVSFFLASWALRL